MSISKKPITARAHTNIALIKYWGKIDEQLIIPQNSSLSLTLDKFYTDTKVQFIPKLTSDKIYVNNSILQNDNKVVHILNIIRQKANIKYYAKVESLNHVPTSAGLASSASAFAALAAAGSTAAGLNLNLTELSRLARRGSGSATRSIFGGWVEWKKGHNDQTSYAESIFPPNLQDVKMITTILKSSKKKISSRTGMKRSVESSPYYPVWRRLASRNLVQAKRAIKQDDLSTLGRLAESNSMRMHALTLSSNPSFSYLNDDSFKVINLVRKMRHNGIPCYFTIDAGPNVKILCRSRYANKIKDVLSKYFNKNKIITSHPGPGILYYNQ